jgi:hypothetical protein
MNDPSKPPFPIWQGPLQDVILELDREKLATTLMEAETLILKRLEQIQQSSDRTDERAAIEQGLSILNMIKRDRLGCPD